MANCRFAITGAAPINTDILRLFQSLGIPLFEGYGMTEDTAGATINYTGMNRIGSVGPAFPNTEIKISKDGEVLIKGRHVMKGYYKNPEATAETIIDGWLHSGDVGEIDGDGFVRITGRKKEIYVTSGGKEHCTPCCRGNDEINFYYISMFSCGRRPEVLLRPLYTGRRSHHSGQAWSGRKRSSQRPL